MFPPPPRQLPRLSSGADGVAEGRDGPGGPAGGPNNLLTQSAADPALRQTVARLFAEWIAICNGKGEATAQPMEQQALEFIGKLQVWELCGRTVSKPAKKINTKDGFMEEIVLGCGLAHGVNLF